jgi:hypothetical protein
MALAASTTKEIRVITMHPTLNWSQIWQNLHMAWVHDDVKSAWFLAIHDIIPTKERLFKIYLADTNQCNQCDQTDTLLHRITECNVEDKGLDSRTPSNNPSHKQSSSSS